MKCLDCGTPMSPDGCEACLVRSALEEAPPPPLGFSLTRRLGGETWLAGDGRVVKFVRESPERFLDEARRAAALDHPNIERIEEVGARDGWGYIVARFVPPGPALLPIDALVYAHERGVVHGNLHPGNIRGDIVIDFGLPLNDPPLRKAAFVAPEETRGAPADVWSLGVILYQLHTGHLPFAGSTPAEVRAQVTGREPLPPRRLNPKISAKLEAAILRALAKNPAERDSLKALAALL